MTHTFEVAIGLEAQTGRLKLAQRLLRHSNLSTTADVYTHTTKQAEREAAIALERAYFGEVVPKLFPKGTESNKGAVN